MAKFKRVDTDSPGWLRIRTVQNHDSWTKGKIYKVRIQ